MKTQAMQRLDDFIEINYTQMLQAATREVGADRAADVLHATYVDLAQREQRGVGCYDPEYGSTYAGYVFGALYGKLRGMRKASQEVVEADLYSGDCEDYDSSPLDRLRNRDHVEDSAFYGDHFETAAEATDEMIAVCAECGMPIVPLVRAVRAADNLPVATDYMRQVFRPLRRAARARSGVMGIVEDFLRVYSDTPDEVEKRLSARGVMA